MKKIWYKFFGIISIIIGVVLVLFYLYSLFISWDSLTSGSIFLVIFISLLTSILSFTPGIFNYKFGVSDKKENKLIKSNLIIIIISSILLLLAFITTIIFSLNATGNFLHPFGFYVFSIIGLLPAAILNGISILLLVIDRFKNKKPK